MKESILLDIDRDELNILTMALAGGPPPPGPLGDLTQPWRRLQDKVRRHQYQSDLLQQAKEPPVATPTFDPGPRGNEHMWEPRMSDDETDEVDYEVTYPLSFVVTVESDADQDRIIEAYMQSVWDWAMDGSNTPAKEFVQIQRIEER